jgi:hypothetical protein
MEKMNNLFYINNIENSNNNYFKINIPKLYYMDDINQNITHLVNLNINDECYKTLYSNQLYNVSLTIPLAQCDSGDEVTGYTFLSYQIELSEASDIRIYKPIGGDYGFRIY